MKRQAFGYVRVSGKGQVEGDGFRRQEDVIQSYAKKRGLEVVTVYREEGISGTTDEGDRPAFQDMVTAILKNGVRTIIVEGLDRLAREYRVQETLLVYLASKGITLISARTEENVTEAVMADPMRKALVQIQGVFAELEKSLLVKKLKQARAAKRAREGKCEGRKGYADDERTKEAVEVIKKLRKTKPGQKRMSCAAIADELNRLEMKTLSGKPWAAGNVQNVLNRF